MKRESKIHFVPVNDGMQLSQCGVAGRVTYQLMLVTCRVCMFRYLAAQAPTVPAFLDNLRGKVRQPSPVSGPAWPAEPTDAQIKRLRDSLGSPFRHQAGSQKAIRELLPIAPASPGPIQPIVHGSGAPTDAVWIEDRQIAQYARDAGQVGDESRRNDESPELWGTPDERSRDRP